MSKLTAYAPLISPNHHLSLKAKTWWVSLTAHKGEKRLRLSRSLKTSDVKVARARRDEIIAAICSQPDARIVLQERRRS